jgi:uncharacterized protein (TIGR03083 family)
MIAPELAVRQLELLVADIVRLLHEADLATAVPSCPGWTVADLVAHLGQTHLWAERCIRVRNPEVPDVVAPVADQAKLAAWYSECASVLLETLRSTDPTTESWTFGLQPHTATFWFRRQAHEAAMHRWDLGAAVGEDLGYSNELAADGVDEVVSMFFPRQVRLRRTAPLTRSLAIQADGRGRWVLAGDGTSESVGPPDAEVSGPADVLVLLLWGRLALEDPRIQLAGDRAAAATVLSARIVP